MLWVCLLQLWGHKLYCNQFAFSGGVRDALVKLRLLEWLPSLEIVAVIINQLLHDFQLVCCLFLRRFSLFLLTWRLETLSLLGMAVTSFSTLQCLVLFEFAQTAAKGKATVHLSLYMLIGRAEVVLLLLSYNHQF